MKILAVSHACVADVNQQLWVEMARCGAQVELVVPARWRDHYNANRAPQRLDAADFPIHWLPVWGRGQIMLHVYHRGITKIVRALRPDLVFIDEEPASLATAQIGAICSALGVPWACNTMQNILKKYPPPFVWLERLTYRNARGITALTPEVQQVLGRKGFRGACPLLPLACDLALFHAAPQAQLRAELGLKSPTIGYLGRFVAEKGLETLIDAAAILRDQSVNFQVLMVGSGTCQDALRARVEAAALGDHFVWAGAVPHGRAADYLRCMDVFALPSLTMPNWKEQFGRVLIEAMACGVPVVGSSSGYIPDLIRQTGGGLVFAENQATDCARALQILLDDAAQRQELGEIGAQAVRARYSYQAIGTRLFTICEQLISKRDDVPGGL